MAPRRLGRTGLMASPIAFGAFKIGRNEKVKYAEAYDVPSDEECGRLLNGVLDLGINVIDTAPAYGSSEERIGRHIGHRRSEYILSTKAGETFERGESTYDFSAGGITASIHRSLRRLRTDVIDFVFIHSDGRDMWILEQTDAVAALLSLRDRGMVRHVGLSGKTPEGATAALKWADAIMVEYHSLDRSHEAAIAEAGKAGVAVFDKKPLAAGRIAAGEAIRFALSNPHIQTLVIGSLDIGHIRDNTAVA